MVCTKIHMFGVQHAGKGRFGSFLAEISEYYLQYHRQYYDADKVFLHDPTAMLAVVRKDLFEWLPAAVVVGCEGHLRGKTVANSAHLRGSAALPVHALVAQAVRPDICKTLKNLLYGLLVPVFVHNSTARPSIVCTRACGRLASARCPNISLCGCN